MTASTSALESVLLRLASTCVCIMGEVPLNVFAAVSGVAHPLASFDRPTGLRPATAPLAPFLLSRWRILSTDQVPRRCAGAACPQVLTGATCTRSASRTPWRPAMEANHAPALDRARLAHRRMCRRRDRDR